MAHRTSLREVRPDPLATGCEIGGEGRAAELIGVHAWPEDDSVRARDIGPRDDVEQEGRSRQREVGPDGVPGDREESRQAVHAQLAHLRDRGEDQLLLPAGAPEVVIALATAGEDERLVRIKVAGPGGKAPALGPP